LQLGWRERRFQSAAMLYPQIGEWRLAIEEGSERDSIGGAAGEGNHQVRAVAPEQQLAHRVGGGIDGDEILIGVGHHILAGASDELISIRTRAAVEGVVASAACEEIVAVAAQQFIVAFAAL